MKKLKLNRQAFTGLDQEALVPYVFNLLQRCAEHPAFDAVGAQRAAVKTAAEEFDLRLSTLR